MCRVLATSCPIVLLLVVAPLGACIDTAPIEPVDAAVQEQDVEGDAPPPALAEVVELLAFDHVGRAWPLDGLPRQPILQLRTSAPITADEAFVFLFEGDLDAEALLDDLRRPPLLSRHEDLLLPLEVDGTTLWPPRLQPGAPYTLGVGAWARDSDGRPLAGPFVASLRVAAVAAGAEVTDSWPADGTAGAPYAIPLIALRFDDEVRGEDIALVGERGPVSGELRVIPCEDVGWANGECRALIPGGPLRPESRYRIEVGEELVDRSGAPVGPWSATFDTGSEAQRPPVFLSLACHLDEYAIGPVCVLADDRSLVVRAQLDAPVRAFLSGASLGARTVANRGEVRLELSPLVAGSTFDGELRLEGLGGEHHVEVLELRAQAQLPTLTIAEVRSDPMGSEPRQEYVELVNFGESPVPLTGLFLADRPDREGDLIDGGQSVPPGARALLVADGFDPEDPADPLVPPGVMLVRIGTSLASGGLTNAGEPLFLRDAAGHRLSAAPAVETGPGRCLVRSGSGRSGDEGSFRVAECTPGTAPR